MVDDYQIIAVYDLFVGKDAQKFDNFVGLFTCDFSNIACGII